MARFNLPDINFAEKSPLLIESEILQRFEQNTGRRLSPADPLRKFVQVIVSALVQLRVNIDFAAKQNLLAFAIGDALDAIGASYETPRLPASPAVTTLRFTLSAPSQLIIPAGTRATAGDGVFFATTQNVVVPGGVSYIDVPAECTQPGTVGNGYLPGQINQLVDPIQWVQYVENITESQGGTDVEDDDSYAERIRLSPESFSVAGPTEAYRYWAMTAHPSIVDVSVHSPAPMMVEIRPLLQGGELPGQEILDAVYEMCNDRRRRPLTDQVQVLAPEVVNYDIDLTYWISTEDASVAIEIQERVNQAIQEYIIWQKSRLGRAIDPSELIARVKNAGAKRVVVTEPINQPIEKYEVAIEQDVNVEFGGLEDG